MTWTATCWLAACLYLAPPWTPPVGILWINSSEST